MLAEEFIEVARQSRIYYNGHLFDYPLRVSDLVRKLRPADSLAVVGTWLWRRVRPVRPERSFRDWVINRFGDRLFHRFFESYTEKVWGIRCSQISADWAAQRIQGFSLHHAIRNSLGLGRRRDGSIKTLIESFHYPKMGCGQMWERARDAIDAAGGHVELDRRVVSVRLEGGRVVGVTCRYGAGAFHDYSAGAVVSSMPLRDLIRCLTPRPPEPVRAAANALAYRDFITVALVVDRADCFPDQWIYIHEPAVRVGRVQNFKNWSAAMVPDEATSVLGLEYFCFEGDTLWSMADEELVALAARELEKVGLVRAGEVRDGKVVRMTKAYPVYDHDYRAGVQIIRGWLAGIPNMWSAGRNAMHQYNNQDHSMAAALLAAANLTGRDTRDPWSINHVDDFPPAATPHRADRAPTG
jgi:protoporphyrinogen oxidase